MHNLSRRSVIGAMAAIPATLGAGHALAAPGSTHPDAEIMALGAEFDRRVAEWLPLRKRQLEKCAVRDDIGEREGLIEFTRDCNDRDRRLLVLTLPREERRSRFDRWIEIQIETGAEDAITAENDALERIDGINKLIRAIQPHTLAGLAVWAKITRFDSVGLEHFTTPVDEIDIENDIDWREECVMRLVLAIEGMAAS